MLSDRNKEIEGVNMTDKEVQKLKRTELLEMLIAQSEENERLKKEVEDLKEQLAGRKISIENAGSIAEAALQLNGVFEAAQSAAQQYIENVRYLNENQETICSEMERKTQEACEEKERRTNEKCEQLKRETAETCKKMLDEAKAGADKQWAEVSERLSNFYEAHKGLREIMEMVGSVESRL